MAHEYRVFAEFESKKIEPGAIGHLNDADRHHLHNVLRLREGDLIIAVARNTPVEFDAQVVRHKDQLAIKVVRLRQNSNPTCRTTTLCCGILRGGNSDIVCEQCVELGVENIIFFVGEQSVVKIKDAGDITNKIARWVKIAESAARQSGRISVPKIFLEIDLAKAIALIKEIATPKDRFYCCSLSPQAKNIRDLQSPPAGVHIVVGPEADFSHTEHESLLNNSFEAIKLSPLRLRAETAAAAAVSMTQAVWGFSS